MDCAEDFLGRVHVVAHEEFDALRIDVVGAGLVVILRDVRQLLRKALSVQVLFAVLSLVLEHVVGNEDILEACLFAVACSLVHLLVAAVQAQVVVLLGHLFCRSVDRLELRLVEGFVYHCEFSLQKSYY